MVKKSVARYVTVGFDTEAAANKFKALIEAEGHLVKLYRKEIIDDEPKGKIHNIQARSVHIWTPRSWERRGLEHPGVAIEFRDGKLATTFLRAATKFLTGELTSRLEDFNQLPGNTEVDPYFREAAVQLALLLDEVNVVGVRMERD